jgi:hypothetical protein
MLHRVAAGVLASLFMVACATEDVPLSWEEFQAQAHQEPDTGIYIINGDEPAESLDHLYRYYLEYRGDVAAIDGVGARRDESIVNTVSGADDVWPSATALNLTYCVDKKSFGSNYTNVVSQMTAAAGAWEGVANVNFIHVSSLDGSCTRRTSGVVFNVRKVSGGQYLARAFFPSTSRTGREILIDASSFGNLGVWTLAGILRHELGHTIGLRHEHTRPESGTCFENNSWRKLTDYDSNSVMHYPQCNGHNTGDLNITASDASGARQLYP